jgi:hypothetical protein
LLPFPPLPDLEHPVVGGLAEYCGFVCDVTSEHGDYRSDADEYSLQNGNDGIVVQANILNFGNQPLVSNE